MRITKDDAFLAMRVANPKFHNFVEEHNRIIEEKGFCWMGKVGRMPSLNSINELIIDKESFIFLKIGEEFYIANFSEISVKPQSNDLYPMYYNSLGLDISIWFNVKKIIQITDKSLIDSIVLRLNGTPILEAMKKSMTSFLYIKANEDIDFAKGGE